MITEAFEGLGVLLILAAGLLFIVGATQIAKRFIFLGLFAVLFAGFHPVLFDEVPLPLLVAAGVLIVLALFGQFLALFIGRRAADVAIGTIVSNLVTAVVVLMFLPVKMLRKLLEKGP